MNPFHISYISIFQKKNKSNSLKYNLNEYKSSRNILFRFARHHFPSQNATYKASVTILILVTYQKQKITYPNPTSTDNMEH